MINEISRILNSIGLLFDILGVWIVSFEIFKSYKGHQFISTFQPIRDITRPPDKSPSFKQWEILKGLSMKIGILFITVGFFLQLWSNWPACWPSKFYSLYGKYIITTNITITPNLQSIVDPVKSPAITHPKPNNKIIEHQRNNE